MMFKSDHVIRTIPLRTPLILYNVIQILKVRVCITSKAFDFLVPFYPQFKVSIICTNYLSLSIGAVTYLLNRSCTITSSTCACAGLSHRLFSCIIYCSAGWVTQCAAVRAKCLDKTVAPHKCCPLVALRRDAICGWDPVQGKLLCLFCDIFFIYGSTYTFSLFSLLLCWFATTLRLTKRTYYIWNWLRKWLNNPKICYLKL